jgi:hypothetical protein
VDLAQKYLHGQEERKMNRIAGGRRELRQIWSPRMGLLIIVAGIALLTAACSGAAANSPGSGTSASSAGSAASGTSGTPATSSPSAGTGTSVTSGESTYQRAVAYANCMRQHGVPNFPDPLPNGGFGLDPSVTGGTNGQVSPQYQAAENACASLSPVGVLSPQQQQHDLSQLLKLSACMRSHGFKDFPDPTFGSQGIVLHIIGFDRNSPQFQDAWNTCLSQTGSGNGSGSNAG